ncbi:MAG: SBBP repeat-containing protein [Acidobacteriia bacterium]|nr:SBBP repeat-containing protein [Terriglobia bacterium]
MRFLLFLFIAGVSFAGQFTTSLGDSYPYIISAITTDSGGNTYIVGSRQLATAGTVTLNSSTNLGAGTDVFVSKLDPSGNLLFTDTFAGKGVDAGTAIALDPSGNIYIGGTTTSPDFPLSEAQQTQSNSNGTGFIIKLTNDGTTILYSTYFGGALGASSVSGLATDTKGNLYVTGLTSASDFVQASGLPTAPLTPVNAFVNVSNVFVAEIPAAGGKILYSGEIAPTGNQAFATAAPGIAVDSAGEVFLRYNNTFNSGFAAKINAAGAGFGFSPISFPATVNAIAVDAAGDAYLATGGTIEKLNPTGTAAWTFTMPPGIVDSSPISIALDASGNVWATGMTSSTTFPNANGWTTGTDFLIAVNSSGSQLTYSALYPSFTVEHAVSVDPSGLVHVAGTNAFVAAIDPQAAPAKNMFVFQNAFRGNATARLSPAEVVAIYGPGIGPSTAVSATPTNGFYPTTLGGVEVSVNGTNIPLLYVSANQINAVFPMEVTANSAATVRVTNGAAVSASYPVRIVGSSPGANPTVINQDGTINSISNPAPGGSIVTFYVTGFQPSFAPLADGQVATVANNDACALESGCTITAQTVAFFHLGSLSVPATVLYAGAAPGIVAGVTQFNLQVGTPPAANEFFLALNGSYIGAAVVVSPN